MRTRVACEHGERLLAFVLDAADPVERVLQQRGDGRVVFGAGDENAGMDFEQRLELARVLRNAVDSLNIGVVERHRIVAEIGERRWDAVDLGDLGAEPR